MHLTRRNTITGRILSLFVCIVLSGLLASVLVVVQSPSTAGAHADDVIIAGMPSVKQWYPLSCEYAAAAAVTLFWGDLVSQTDFIGEVPSSPNPHKGFRGDINGDFGSITNYGVYAEALVPVLEKHGYSAEAFYGGVGRLKSEIADGHPIVVWLTAGRSEHSVYRKSYDGEPFKLVPYEHTVVAYGYNSSGVYLMDVGDGGRYFTEWNAFLWRWSYFDQMALLIHPK